MVKKYKFFLINVLFLFLLSGCATFYNVEGTGTLE
jgi:hypothetical protein